MQRISKRKPASRRWSPCKVPGVSERHPEDTRPRPTRAARATLRDVAQRAGVHPSLVSRVVNDDPKAYASDETRQRIMSAVRELGYRPHFAARGLRMSRSLTIGLLVPDLSNPMYPPIIRGIEAQAQNLGYGLIIGSHVEGSTQATFNHLLEQSRVDALIVASGLVDDAFVRGLAEIESAPVVSLNRRVRGVRASVTVDDERGARLAVEHLAALGHRQIGGVFGSTKIDTARRRDAGYEGALRDLGLRPLKSDQDSWTMRAGYQGGLDLLRRRKPPTAIFAPSIAMGIGVLRAAQEEGIAVPGELSTIALHDSDIADYLAPPLTTVAMPAEDMGRQAAELAVELINGGKPRHILVPGEPTLVVRSTTASPTR